MSCRCWGSTLAHWDVRKHQPVCQKDLPKLLAKKRLVMTVPAPHFLLYSQAQLDAAQAGCGQWRFVLESADGAARLEAADEEAASAQRLELLAIVRGLEALDQPSRVTLVTGSRYVSRGIRFGLTQWREDGWQWERYGEMSPVKDHDLWRRVDQALQFHEVECRSVRQGESDDLHAMPLRLLPATVVEDDADFQTDVRVVRPQRRHRGKSLRFDAGERPPRKQPAQKALSWRSRLSQWWGSLFA
ncbi:MAG: RNase H family protein [Pirellulaceae bacterium]